MRIAHAVVMLIAPVLLTACSSTRTIRVAVPPRVDLAAYPAVGLVQFTSSAGSRELEELATQKFLRELQAAQPGTRVVELGTESEVLASVGGRNWNPATLRKIGEEHGVDVVITGRLQVEQEKPQISLSTMWKSVSARQDVTATLTARLSETGSGATVWTDSSDLTANVAHLSLNGRGQGHFGASDAESAYGEMIRDLACAITDDFREHYVTRRVPKDYIETASVHD